VSGIGGIFGGGGGLGSCRATLEGGIRAWIRVVGAGDETNGDAGAERRRKMPPSRVALHETRTGRIKSNQRQTQDATLKGGSTRAYNQKTKTRTHNRRCHQAKENHGCHPQGWLYTSSVHEPGRFFPGWVVVGWDCGGAEGERIGEGTGIGEFGGRGAEAFADWIHPDVGGNVMDGGGSAQDVVVEFALPELVAGAVMKLVFGFLFEGIDEEEKVGVVRRSGDEDMEVIGHRAIGVDGE
jgi:hypothetical protein